VPYDTTVVAMSSTSGPLPVGTPNASGLVPSSESAPPHTAMWLALATAEYIPIMPAAAGISA